MARSIRIFGDAPLGWRYPSVLEQVRLIQVMPAMKIRKILDKP
jgi:predicted membrane-bound dolichyl-phosphate-mannose-protein mannosyltransferase